MRSGPRLWIVILPFLAVLTLWVLMTFGRNASFISSFEKWRLWFSETFAWVFIAMALLALITMVLSMVMLGHIKIGHNDEEPRMSSFEAVAVGFAAATSMGLFYWAAAEPLFHVSDPPNAMKVLPRSKEAQTFARAAAYMHWGILAQAIFGVMMVGFAVSSQRIRRAASLDGLIFRKRHHDASGPGTFFDAIIIFFATLLLISGLSSAIPPILQLWTGGAYPNTLWIGLSIVGCMIFILFCAGRPPQTSFLAMAKWSLILLLILLAVVTVLGPTMQIFMRGLVSLWWTIKHSGTMLLGGFSEIRDGWAVTWTVTHLAGWMIFAPLIGYFLSEAARGFTLSNAIFCFIIGPAMIIHCTIMVIGGLTLHTDASSQGLLWNSVLQQGAGAALFGALGTLKGAIFIRWALALLLLLAFIGFASAVLFATMRFVAQGSVRQSAVIANRRFVLIIWTILFGVTAWAVSTTNLFGLVTGLGRLGGLPALFIFALSTLAVLRLCFEPAKNHNPLKDDEHKVTRYEVDEDWKIAADDEEALETAIKRGRPPERDF